MMPVPVAKPEMPCELCTAYSVLCTLYLLLSDRAVIMVLTMTATFHVPSTILIGGGARREVAAQLQQLQVQRVLLVTDAGMVQLGPAREVAALCAEAGLAVTIFDGVQPDPTDRNVTEGLERFCSEKCEAIVAVGGGSPSKTAPVL